MGERRTQRIAALLPAMDWPRGGAANAEAISP
jgi:hypothetical protein